MPTFHVKADTSDARRDIKKLDKEVDQFARSSARSLQKMERSFRTLKTLGIGLGGFFSAQIVAGYAKELVNVADQYTNINSKINLVTDGAEEFNRVYDTLYNLSRDTGTTLDANSQAYTKLANSMKEATSEDILGYLDTVNKSLVTSGAEAQEASAFMLQFAQAMGSGVVAGDELKSMNEANSYLMAKVAEKLGTTISGLKKMGAEGTLSAQKFAGALKLAAAEVDADFEGMGLTVDRAWNNMKQVFNRIISESDTAGGGTNALAQSIKDLADEAELHRPEITEFLGGLVAKIPEAVTGIGDIAKGFGEIGSSISGAVSGLDSALGIGWKEIGLAGLILYGSKQIGAKRFGPIIAALAIIAQKEAERGRGWEDVNDQTKEHQEEIEKLIGKTQKLADIDFALEGEFLDIDTFQNQLIAIDMMLDNAFADIDMASAAEQVGKNAGSALVDGMSKEAKKKLEKLSKSLSTDIGRVSEQLRDLELEGMPGGSAGQGAYDSLIAEAGMYEEAAKSAAAAGDWDSARKNVEAMVNALNKLPDKVTGGLAPTDNQINKQKQLIQHYKEMVGQHTSFYAKRQYLDKAKAAQQELNRLIKEQEGGVRTIISEEEVRIAKVKELQDAQRILKGLQKEAAQAIPEEEKKKTAGVDTTEADAAKKSLEDVKRATESTKTTTQQMNQEVVKVGGEWVNVAAKVEKDTIKGIESAGKATKDVKETTKQIGQEVVKVGDVWTNMINPEILGTVTETLEGVKIQIAEVGTATEINNQQTTEIGKTWKEVTPEVVANLEKQRAGVWEIVEALKAYEAQAKAAAAASASIPAFNSNGSDSDNIPGRYAGGPVIANNPYIVGERGPELFVPNQSGNIVPNNQIGQDGVERMALDFTFNGKSYGTMYGKSQDVKNIIDGLSKFRENMA